MEQLNIFNALHEKFKIDNTNGVRLFEAFAGYGAFHMAMKRLGWNVDLVGYSEIDKYAIKVYEELHNAHGKNYGAIGSFDRLPPNIDICTWSFPCFPKGSLVLTKKGYKDISNLSLDDYVITHNNKWQKVVRLFNNGYQETMKIKAMGIDEIIATHNHKFYVRELKRVGHKSIRTFEQPIWKEARCLTSKDYLGIPIIKESKIPTWNGYYINDSLGRTYHKNDISKYLDNKYFWWILGRYLGDGWQKSEYTGIIICDNKNTYKEITDRLDILELNYTVVYEKTVVKIHISKKELALYCDMFGKYAHGKKVPIEVLELPIELAKSFLEGYLSADGSVSDKTIRCSSVSRELIYGIGMLVSKVYNRPYSIYKSNSRKHIIQGRDVKTRDNYSLHFKLDNNKQDKAFYENGYIWYPVIETIENGRLEVFDIEVQHDHSFTVQNTIVHNCQDISLAGKQRGMVDGSRSNYGYVFLDTVANTPYNERPKVLIMENVRALFSEKFREDWREIQRRLDAMGYTSYSEILNAKDYGVAQNRERVFIVSILGGGFYEFPKPYKMTKRLKDYLEDEVDEKYYLSAKQIQSMIESKYESMGIDRIKTIDDVCNAITTMGGGNREPKIAYAATSIEFKQKGMIQTIKTSVDDIGVVVGEFRRDEGLRAFKDDVIGTIRTIDAGGDKVVVSYIPFNATIKEVIKTFDNGHQLVVLENGIGAINTEQGLIFIRKLTPREALRLMDVSEDDINIILSLVSNTQAYKLAGNSIVVNVLVEMFKEMIP
jgi:DNA-cytosine methyltransferase